MWDWSIGITGSENLERQSVKNHSGAREFPNQIDEYIARELGEGTLLGPLKKNPLWSPMVGSPLNITEKRDSSERQVIMDLSFPPGWSVNDRIPKEYSLGEVTGLRHTSIDALTKLVREKGADCPLMKCDLKRACKQIFVDPRDWNWGGEQNCILLWQRVWVWGWWQCAARGSLRPWGTSWDRVFSIWWCIWMTWWHPSVGIKPEPVSPHYRKSLLPWEQWRLRVRQ